MIKPLYLSLKTLAVLSVKSQPLISPGRPSWSRSTKLPAFSFLLIHAFGARSLCEISVPESMIPTSEALAVLSCTRASKGIKIFTISPGKCAGREPSI